MVSIQEPSTEPQTQEQIPSTTTKTQAKADPSLSTTAPTAPTALTAVSDPILHLHKCIIRPYRPTDAAAIALVANHPEIARFMRNTFPSPYTLRDAEHWLSIASPLDFAVIALDNDDERRDVLAGAVGLRRLADVESRTMEIGYWLGQAHWGRGIATEALRRFSLWAFENVPDVLRLEACVFGDNPRSAAVLRKVGYTFEGTRRKAVVKNGVVLDMMIYSLLREEQHRLSESNVAY